MTENKLRATILFLELTLDKQANEQIKKKKKN